MFFTNPFCSNAGEKCVHISVGSMLARSTLQGMLEPQFVGRVKSIVPTSFLCAVTIIQHLLEAKSGSKEANDKRNDN